MTPRRSLVVATAVALAAAVGAGASSGPPPAPAPVSLRELGSVSVRTAALMLSGQHGGSLEGALAVGPREAVEGGQRVPFWVEIDGASLLGGRTGGHAVLELVAYALDADDRFVSFAALEIHLDLAATSSRLAASGLKVAAGVDSPPGVHTVRVMVRDRDTAAFFLGQGRAGDTAASIVFPDAPDLWLWVVAPRSGTGPVPAARPVVAMDAPTVLGLPWLAPGATVRLRLLSGDGTDVVAAEAAVGETDGRPVVVWDVPFVDPGGYVLAVEAAGKTAETEVILVDLDEGEAAPTWASLAADRDTARRVAVPQGRRSARPREIRAGYRRAAALLAAGDTAAARRIVDETERRAVSDGRAGSRERLHRVELAVATRLADSRAEAIVPLLALHHDIFLRRCRTGDRLLATHAMMLASDLAELLAARVPELRPSAADALASLGEELAEAAGRLQALDLFHRAVALDPGHVPALFATAMVHEWYGETDDAITAFEAVLRAEPESWEARLRLGVNLQRRGQRRAADLLRGCLDPAAPGWVRVIAYEELARDLLDRGNTAGARALLVAGAAALPDAQSLLVLHAYVAELDGDGTTSRSILDTVATTAPRADRTSPRRRYASWPTPLFAPRREALRRRAAALTPALDAAVSATATAERAP